MSYGATLRRILADADAGKITTALDDHGKVLLTVRGIAATPEEIQAVRQLARWLWIDPPKTSSTLVVTDTGRMFLDLLGDRDTLAIDMLNPCIDSE